MYFLPLTLPGLRASRQAVAWRWRRRWSRALEIVPQRLRLPPKQAAEADVLTGGRLRLGVGVGWNSVEYDALGMDFQTRGARIEEQVPVLRALWTQESVAFHGQWHIEESGINPLPVQRPIPIWMGGDADIVLRRIARFADGWFARPGPPSERHRTSRDRLHRYVVEAGRDPKTVGLKVQLHLSRTGLDECRDAVDAWNALGATHLFLSTLGVGLETPDGHIR
ncbi:MAG: TIGR03619 family F420-dependent LLM class oxidoreductase [Armatimonadota bacterium]